jgi:hypothetical protein
MKNDKRKIRRRPMRYTAWLALGPGEKIGCRLSDISEGGARIDVEDTSKLPDQFILMLSVNGRAHRACQVVWRNSNQLGVKFEKHLAAAKRAARVPAAKVNVDPAPSESEPAKSA